MKSYDMKYYMIKMSTPLDNFAIVKAHFAPKMKQITDTIKSIDIPRDWTISECKFAFYQKRFNQVGSYIRVWTMELDNTKTHFTIDNMDALLQCILGAYPDIVDFEVKTVKINYLVEINNEHSEDKLQQYSESKQLRFAIKIIQLNEFMNIHSLIRKGWKIIGISFNYQEYELTEKIRSVPHRYIDMTVNEFINTNVLLQTILELYPNSADINIYSVRITKRS